MYTSMEPCSRRLSGKESCTSRLLRAGVRRVVVGIREPTNFVACDGLDQLRAAGVSVILFDHDETVRDLCVRAHPHLDLHLRPVV